MIAACSILVRPSFRPRSPSRTSRPRSRARLLPPTLNLAELHHVIQAAFGWLDCHLHQFVVGGLRYGAPELLELEFQDRGVMDQAIDGRKGHRRVGEDLVRQVLNGWLQVTIKLRRS